MNRNGGSKRRSRTGCIKVSICRRKADASVDLLCKKSVNQNVLTQHKLWSGTNSNGLIGQWLKHSYKYRSESGGKKGTKGVLLNSRITDF